MEKESLAQIAVRGNVLYSAERFREAESCYRYGIELYPEVPLLLRSLALSLLMQHKYERAIEYFQACLASGEDDSTTRYALATALFGAAKGSNDDSLKRRAVREMQRAVAMDPNNPMQHSDLAKMYSDLGKSRSSYLHMYRAIRLAPFSENYVDDFVKLVAFNDQFHEAIETLNAEISGGGELRALLYPLAHLYQACGMTSSALECLGKAALYYPQYYKISNKFLQMQDTQ